MGLLAGLEEHPVVGDILDGSYELISELGSSSATKVFLAADQGLKRKVVLRILREELVADEPALHAFSERMKRESKLSHDNILLVLKSGAVTPSTGRGPDVPYYVTDFLPMGNLRSMLDINGRLSLAQTLVVGLDVAKGLQYAHWQNTAHLDIRPENLLFGIDSQLRIKDFGLARTLAEYSNTEQSHSGRPGNLYGAPELVSGGGRDLRCDIYSLALVLVECVTGEVPLTGASTTETFELRARDGLVLPRDFGPLRDILERAGHANPRERPDATEFCEGLQQASSHLPPAEPLPLVPTLGEHASTERLDRSLITTTTTTPARTPDAENPVGVDSTSAHDVSADAAIKSELAVEPEGRPIHDPTVIAEPGTDPQPNFASVLDRTSVESILAPSEPKYLGPVKPFGVDEDEGIEDGDIFAPVEQPSRGRKRVVLPVAIIVVLLGAIGGYAYWWSAIRIPQHLVPRAEGLMIEPATSALKKLNFVVDSSVRERRDGTEPGQVLSQSPAKGTKLDEGSTVRLTVSLGPTLRVLPQLIGLTRDDAVAALTAADLQLGAETPQNDETVPVGTVISSAVSQDGSPPDDSGQVPRDTKVDLVVSAGPAPRIVPSGLIGASAEQARAALEEIQLVANILEAYDNKAPKGQIISSSAKAGDALERGAKVTLTMSIGPEPIAVPNVIGMSGSTAASTLESAGFIVEGIEGSPTGLVLQTDPTPGEKRQRSTSVRIFTKSK